MGNAQFAMQNVALNSKQHFIDRCSFWSVLKTIEFERADPKRGNPKF